MFKEDSPEFRVALGVFVLVSEGELAFTLPSTLAEAQDYYLRVYSFSHFTVGESRR